MAELAQLIGQGGAWQPVWLAAHWDRQLKKKDYEGTDIRGLVADFFAKRALISLRATGHLLLGISKVYAKRSQLLDDEAVEVRTRLWLAGTSNGQDALRNGAGRPGEAGDDLDGVADLGELPDLSACLGEQALQSGKRHVARMEDITLKEPAAKARRARASLDEDFGAMTGAEYELAMRELRKKNKVAAALEEPLPFEDTMPLVAFETSDVEGPAQPLVSVGPLELPPGMRVEMDADIVNFDDPLEFDIPAVPPMDAEVVTLRFNGLSMAAIDAEAFRRALLDQFRALGVSETTVAKFRVRLLDGSVVAEVRGSPEALAELREKVKSGSVVVMGDAGILESDVRFDEPFDPEEAAQAIAMHGDAEGVAEPLALASEGGAPKRRRRTYFIFDEATEIPKDTYQKYVNDRSSITRKDIIDYTVFLPHYAPSMPQFTTTFTDLCPALVDCLLKGTEVAEKRRRLLQEAEGPMPLLAGVGGQVGLSPGSVISPSLAAGLAPASGGFLSPALSPLSPEQTGLKSPLASPADSFFGHGPAPGSVRAELPTEQNLLENAPVSLAGVVTGTMDQEDQSGNSEVRIGYSGRTEKMHRFLAKNFVDSKAGSLSYERMCRTHAQGRRDLVAGCFFELLVLKTNGVIGLNQDNPEADIKISKASQWAK
eukprot:TRINITY_DN6003_c0_g1_i2.p1 TRINITY_DN6003_c0_g1~~TRINITY_DN6003_c0_g1_i2.p1  ORF type:complete len:656 (-),score=142.63 TRINITY_DN6003_c0_g1_i2:71-2038(-)